MRETLRALIAEDNQAHADLMVRELKRAGYDLDWLRVDTEEAYIACLDLDWHIVLSDYDMPQFSGFRALALLQERGLEIPFIIVSGVIGEERAVEAMKLGATDYLLKDRLTRLGPAVEQALAQYLLRRERRRAQQTIERGLERLNDAQRIGRIGDWNYDNLTQAISWSPQVYTIVGRDPQLGPPRTLQESCAMYDGPSQVTMRNTLALATESSQVQHCELIGQRPNGEAFHTEATAASRTDADGKVVGLYGTIQDVTARVRASALLSENQHRLELAKRSANIGIWDFNVAKNTLAWDARMYELYGMREQDFSGAYDAWKNGLHPADRVRAELELAEALNGGKDFHTEFRVVWPNGEERDIEAHATVQRAADGTATGMVGVNWDITERKRAEVHIRRLNRVYAVLSGINSLIVRTRNREDLFSEACQIAVDLGRFKFAWIGVIDSTATMILPMASAAAWDLATLAQGGFRLPEAVPLAGASKTARAAREGTTVVTNEIFGDTTMVLAKDRRDLDISSMAILPLLVSGETVGVLELYSDEANFFDQQELRLLEELAGDIAFATDYIEKQKWLDYVAYYDVLTGLANRNLFLERLGAYMREAADHERTLALALFDVERFKNINDSLGRPSGDSLLRQIAEWLTTTFSDASLVARVGADHFAAVLPSIEEGDLAGFVEKAVEAFLEQPFRLNNAVFRVAVKVGVALFPADGTSADILFKNAELALKKAKSSGGRYLRYTQRMSDALAGKLSLENQLRMALEREEFVLHYQPKVDLLDGKLTGAEALIRWNDPKTGLVPPDQFIPLLEETGLIFEVGRWALRKAVTDYLRWHAAGLPVVRIAVNVSPMQLRQRGFIAEIADVIDVSSFAAAGLELEITESMVMEDVNHSVASLLAIRSMGVSVALDDFGTGFSSLSYLTKLPVDSVKIDRSFMQDMTGSPQGLALVSTIVNLAHSLKLKVVAEGVETEEQSRLLRLLGCDAMQGYLISRPVSGDIFESKYVRST
jgi:diguanylate cyclase (GGDEF)-like protein/PAS domain S-box-containing protein